MPPSASSNQNFRRPPPSEGDTNTSARRLEWSEANLSPATMSLLDRDTASFLHQSVSTPCLTAIAKADGIYIQDADGNRYMDFHGNNAHHIGYGHPRLKAAIASQMDDLSFAPRRFTCEPAVQLAERLAEIAPGDLEKSLFATGGSDAMEIALKVARMATGRFKTLSFWDSFHGAGFGAASIGGEQLFRAGPMGPLLPGAEHVAPFACYRCPYGYPVDEMGQPDLNVCKRACANMVRYVLEKEGDVAAVVAEPARAVPYLPPPGFWQSVRDACNDNGTLLIFDEIPTGLGKTGAMFACDHDGVIPDILVLGKALGGGILPIAAAICRPDLDVAGDYALGHYTHEKNPVTSRAALTTLDIIREENLVNNAASLGNHALERLQDMKERHRIIGDIRGLGLLLGVELVRDRDTKEPATDAAEDILYRCLSEGLSFKTTMGNILALTPPLVTTIQQMDTALDILDQALETIA